MESVDFGFISIGRVADALIGKSHDDASGDFIPRVSPPPTNTK